MISRCTAATTSRSQSMESALFEIMWHRITWPGSLQAVALLACIACAAVSSTYAVPAPEQSKVPQNQRLDVNRASLEELEKLPGITQIWAERIVRFRPYHAKND